MQCSAGGGLLRESRTTLSLEVLGWIVSRGSNYFYSEEGARF